MRRPGDRIEKYELLMPVARGGMGSVWAAKLHGPHGFEKTVAIKTVLPELATDAAARAMFLDEARLAAAIDHRNVARVLDFMEHEGALYLVMEWVEGISLADLHERIASEQRTRIPLGITLRILADVCAGLHAAHELTYTNGEPCRLVHRDVCPHNVVVALEGSAKLIDFGVAKTRFRVAPDSTLGELRGRIDFMSPEQAQAAPLDRRADVWSVGAVLFYLLSGHGLFGMRHRMESLRRLANGATPLPPPPNTPPAVTALLTGCLARRREDRFATAAHLGWAIEEAIDDMGVAATARDVAEFLADRGARVDPRLAITGRCAIPAELTLLRPDTVSGVMPARRGSSRASKLRWSHAALACVATIGLAVAGARALRGHAPAPASRASPVLVDDVPTAPKVTSVPASPVPPSAPASSTAPTLPRWEPGTDPHKKAPRDRPTRPRAATSHDRFQSTP
jgi:serine/threonine-protein kinase